ncbi:MAG: hypothetical protein QF869_07150 [Alphaproteobacteria bacterium]|nr:hypothetical protein [Alphaproteobacteria bacterium]
MLTMDIRLIGGHWMHVAHYRSSAMNRSLFGAVAVAVMLLMPMSTSAQSHGDNQQDPRELLEGGVKMMLQALELFINTIPQYEEPEVLENGDIIIRRKPKKLEQPSLDVDTEDDQIKM